jgi:hypothetical protein
VRLKLIIPALGAIAGLLTAIVPPLISLLKPKEVAPPPTVIMTGPGAVYAPGGSVSSTTIIQQYTSAWKVGVRLIQETIGQTAAPSSGSNSRLRFPQPPEPYPGAPNSSAVVAQPGSIRDELAPSPRASTEGGPPVGVASASMLISTDTIAAPKLRLQTVRPAAEQMLCSIYVRSLGVSAKVSHVSFDNECHAQVTSLFQLDFRGVPKNLWEEGESIRKTAELQEEIAKANRAIVERYPTCSSQLLLSDAFSVAKGIDWKSTAQLSAALREQWEKPSGRSETALALISAIPRQLQSRSVLVDVGSGNTKIASLKSNGEVEVINLEIGSKTLRTEAGQDDRVRLDAARVILGDRLRNLSILQKTSHIYWVGGTAWATAAFARPEQIAAPLVQLSEMNIVGFRDALRNGTWLNRASTVPPDSLQGETWKSEWSRVADVFDSQTLLGGLQVLDTILSSMETRPNVFFSRSSDLALGLAIYSGRISSGECR